MIRTVGIVSLSSGILGEPFVQHEVRLGLARLQDYGLQVRFLPHAARGSRRCVHIRNGGRRICCRRSGTRRSI